MDCRLNGGIDARTVARSFCTSPMTPIREDQMAKKKVDAREQISALAEELERHSDRGAGLLAAAVLEDALAVTIQLRLQELSSDCRESLFGRTAPFSSFTTKIELGFALGLYGTEVCKAIEMIRDVCGRFTDKIEIQSFDDSRITELLNKAMTPHLPRNLPSRQLFTMLFIGSICLLYLEQTIDIRVVSLCETHPRLFVQANSAAVQQVTASTTPDARKGPEVLALQREALG